MMKTIKKLSLVGCVCCGLGWGQTATAAESDRPAAAPGDAKAVSPLPASLEQPIWLPRSTPMFAAGRAATLAAGRRCVVSDDCFPRPRLAVDDRVPETIPGDSIRLGEYGPVLLKFTGTRVKMRVRF